VLQGADALENNRDRIDCRGGARISDAGVKIIQCTGVKTGLLIFGQPLRSSLGHQLASSAGGPRHISDDDARQRRR
jgi:hypothetical protein